MSWVIGLIVGGIVGWISVYAMSPDRRGSILSNVIVGAIGGVLGIWFFFLALGIMTSSVAANYWLAILWAIVGSVVLVAIVNSLAVSMSRNSAFYENRRMEQGRGYPHEYDEVEVKKRRREE